jgi:hypothetical protein
MEHFNKVAGCQWVRYKKMPVKGQNHGKFCSQSANMGTKHGFAGTKPKSM